MKHGNTLNLSSHLRDNHPDEYAEASKFIRFGVQISIISKYRDDCDNNN